MAAYMSVCVHKPVCRYTSTEQRDLTRTIYMLRVYALFSVRVVLLVHSQGMHHIREPCAQAQHSIIPPLSRTARRSYCGHGARSWGTGRESVCAHHTHVNARHTRLAPAAHILTFVLCE